MNEINLPLYAAMLGSFLIIIQSFLMLSVGLHRGKYQKGVGVDGDQTLERKVRRHGNLTENGPTFIAVLAIYELLIGQTALAFWLTVVFSIARLSHIIGFSNNAGSHNLHKSGPLVFFMITRALGAFGTLFSSVVLGSALLYYLWTL